MPKVRYSFIGNSNQTKRSITVLCTCMHQEYYKTKLFYFQALIQLAEFDRAKEALNKAKECKLRDKDILAAFKELEV